MERDLKPCVDILSAKGVCCDDTHTHIHSTHTHTVLSFEGNQICVNKIMGGPNIW